MAADPLFVVGAARSGTSYLHSLLNCHPAICMSYESSLPLEGHHLYRQAAGLDTPTGFNRYLDRLYDLEKKEDKNQWLCRSIQANRHRLFHRHKHHRRFQGILEDIFHFACPTLSCFGNKMLRAELCPDIEALWPNARFIVLIRDPRAVVASQIKRFSGRRLAYAAIYCNTHMIQAVKAVKDRPNHLILSYEDLVNAPEKTLLRLLTFAGLSDPFHIKPMLARRPPHGTSVDKWRRTLTRRQIRKIETYCYDMMKTFGYTPDLATAQKTISAVEKTLELGYEKRTAMLLPPEQWRRKRLIQRFLKILTL
jgi:hypothetical protein